MKNEDFNVISSMLKERSGLIITQDKMYLLDSRLMPIARKHNMTSLDDLVSAIRFKHNTQLIEEVVEAMTTNETSFYRDSKPFDQLSKFVLPYMHKAREGSRSLRIWSAASSTGQEAYTIAMTIKEMAAKFSSWNIEIVGTDLSKEVVVKAREGAYTQFEVQRGMPITHLVKYFKQQGDKWLINPEIKAFCQFKEFNLLHSMAGLGKFDIVFLRNVLIYFDQPTKAKVLQSVANQMADDGVLYLGGAETVLGITNAFEPVQGLRGIYALTKANAFKLADDLKQAM